MTDTIEQFIREVLVLTDDTSWRMEEGVVIRHYRQWCKEHELPMAPSPQLIQTLRTMGVRWHPYYHFSGLRLRSIAHPYTVEDAAAFYLPHPVQFV